MIAGPPRARWRGCGRALSIADCLLSFPFFFLFGLFPPARWCRVFILCAMRRGGQADEMGMERQKDNKTASDAAPTQNVPLYFLFAFCLCRLLCVPCFCCSSFARAGPFVAVLLRFCSIKRQKRVTHSKPQVDGIALFEFGLSIKRGAAVPIPGDEARVQLLPDKE